MKAIAGRAEIPRFLCRPAGIHHGQVRFALSLKKKSRGNPKKLMLIEGLRAHQLVSRYRIDVETLFICESLLKTPELKLMANQVAQRATHALSISEKIMKRLSERDGPCGILSICRFPLWNLASLRIGNPSLVVVLDGLEIPGNIGTIIRSMDGAGADALILCNRRAGLIHPKVLKGSQGTCLCMPTVECSISEAREWLLDNGFEIYLADASSAVDFRSTSYCSRVALIAGSERYGLSREWYSEDTRRVSIPMHGDADSLNVGVATSILMYEIASKQR